MRKDEKETKNTILHDTGLFEIKSCNCQYGAHSVKKSNLVEKGKYKGYCTVCTYKLKYDEREESDAYLDRIHERRHQKTRMEVTEEVRSHMKKE